MPYSATFDNLKLVGAVLREVLGESSTGLIRSTPLSQRLFEMVGAGQRDFETLKAEALAMQDNVTSFADYPKTGL